MLGDVSLRIDVWYASRRPDLNCVDLVMDLLQDNGIYANDRQVKAAMAIWNLDRENPRCWIQVIPLESEGSCDLSSLEPSKIWDLEPRSKDVQR